MNDEVIEYLKDKRSLYKHEQIALSEAEFSKFLAGLLDVIQGAK